MTSDRDGESAGFGAGVAEAAATSAAFAEYARMMLEAVLARAALPDCPTDLSNMLIRLQKSAAPSHSDTAVWPLQRHFLMTEPLAVNPVGAQVFRSWGQPPVIERLKARFFAIKKTLSGKRAGQTGTDLVPFIAEMAVSGGPFQMQASVRMRDHLAERVMFPVDEAPFPRLHPNSFLILWGLSVGGGVFARAVAAAVPRKGPAWVPQGVVHLWQQLTSRWRRAPGPEDRWAAANHSRSVQLAHAALRAENWMSYWDWWVIARAVEKLPRFGASPLLKEMDRISETRAELGANRGPLSEDWDGTTPDFMEYYDEED